MDQDTATEAFRAGRDADAERLASAALDAPGTDTVGTIDALCVIARVALRAGDLERAALMTATATERAGDDPALRQVPLHLAAAIARLRGDLRTARSLFLDSIELNRVLGVDGAIAVEERNLAYVALGLGDRAEALRLLDGAGRGSGAPERLLDRAVVAAIRGDLVAASTLLDGAERRYVAEGRVPDPDDAAELQRLRDTTSQR